MLNIFPRIASYIFSALTLVPILTNYLYAAIPAACSTSCPPVEIIFDHAPQISIPLRDQDYYSTFWTYPDDYVLGVTPGGLDIAIAADNKGGNKIFQYSIGAGTIDKPCAWGATITVEGNIILHGARCDTRSEVCILVPYGYSVDGLGVGETVEVVEAITLDPMWEADAAYLNRQYFTLIATDPNGNPQLIYQEVTWDTDNESPVVKTRYPGEEFTIYSLNYYADRWRSWGDALADKEKYAPIPILEGYKNRYHQVYIAMRFIDQLVARDAVESGAFDNFRNPELVP